MSKCIVINIPLSPPPVNGIWRTVRIGGKQRTLLSARARTFYKEGCELITGRPEKPLSCRLRVHIKWYPPDRRVRDIDGILKAIFDLLTKANVWEDDSLVDFLSVSRETITPKGKVTIEIWPLPEEH